MVEDSASVTFKGLRLFAYEQLYVVAKQTQSRRNILSVAKGMINNEGGGTILI